MNSVRPSSVQPDGVPTYRTAIGSLLEKVVPQHGGSRVLALVLPTLSVGARLHRARVLVVEHIGMGKAVAHTGRTRAQPAAPEGRARAARWPAGLQRPPGPPATSGQGECAHPHERTRLLICAAARPNVGRTRRPPTPTLATSTAEAPPQACAVKTPCTHTTTRTVVVLHVGLGS
eukprot:scaffold571_cov364-Prasinococcus_capsulatus_cf.AAC.17